MIQKGSQVKIHYTLKVDGKVVDSSVGKDPLAFEQGGGQIIEGLEEQLAGLKVGDKKECELAPEKGYGLPNPDAVRTLPRTAFTDPDSLKPGDVVSGHHAGMPFTLRVSTVGPKEISLDMNHPLAGKTLHFAVEVVEVQ